MKRCKLLILLVLCILLIGCSAEVNVTKCEMNVKQGSNDIPCETGYFNFGDISLGYSQSITFTIENAGDVDLNLTGDPLVAVKGQNTSDFTASTNLTASIVEAGADTTFTIHFKPTSTGDRTAKISIDNDDGNENPYTFVVVGKCKAAAVEINVKQGATDILCATGSYDLGSAYTGDTSSPVIFTIENSGNDNLVLSGNPPIAVVGSDASMFYVNDDDTLTTISAGNSTTFEVSFRPVVSAGIKTARISILSNDSDENPYTFTITGTALAKPEINVKQGSTNIPCNTGAYDFRKIYLGKSSQEISFTIENIGAAQIDLTGSPDLIEISGANKAMFSTNQTMTTASIAPGDSTTFTVIFTPTSEGMKSVNISIENNDDDENPYTFTIEGTGVTPEINVKQDSDNIENSTGKYEFIGVKVSKSTSEIEFTIQNLGTGNLLLTGSPIVEITGTHAAEFSITAMPTLTTISPSSNTKFKIQCHPTSRGLKTATISIVNNDLDENPYTFTITGFGVVYTEGDINGDGLVDLLLGHFKIIVVVEMPVVRIFSLVNRIGIPTTMHQMQM